ncbi:hypothetical protein [Nocardioides aestuarii]|uniref:Immunity protein Imm1 n=1 Tax=Nocardioides aestuarii TaxID=252231 RepID=A0ABW4TRV3_9ACTN
MEEQWHLPEDTRPVEAPKVAELIQRRVSEGTMTTWLESSRGRTIVLVSNGSRAMVMLLDHGNGDPGEHATDPTAAGSSDGFVLENGQVDEYPDHDTVPMREALRIVTHLVADGTPPSDASWHVDR